MPIKGYDSAVNRHICVAYGYRDRILRRRTSNGRRTHAKRDVIERIFSWLDKHRRLILRYERCVDTYMRTTCLPCGSAGAHAYVANEEDVFYLDHINETDR